METIWADFNARTADDRVSLETLGSRRALEGRHVIPGQRVWISNGEVRVEAVIESTSDGLFARPTWETLEDLVEGVAS